MHNNCILQIKSILRVLTDSYFKNLFNIKHKIYRIVFYYIIFLPQTNEVNQVLSLLHQDI